MVTPEGLPGIGGHRYEGYSLGTKYGWMQQGSGADAVAGGTEFLSRLAKDFADSERALRGALGELGVSWDGTAAESASTALTRVADWARGTAERSAGGGSKIAEYADSFARMKPRIFPPPEAVPNPVPGPVPGSVPGSVPGGGFAEPGHQVGSDFGAVAGLQDDYRARLARYQRLDRAANDALYAHEANSRAAVQAFPLPDAPPAVTTLAAAPIATDTVHSTVATSHRPPSAHPGAAATGTAGVNPAGVNPAGVNPAGTAPGGTPPPDHAPTTTPAAGGVARVGGAVPDQGPSGGVTGPAGPDLGGVLPGGLPGHPGYYPDSGADGHGPERSGWARPRPTGGGPTGGGDGGSSGGGFGAGAYGGARGGIGPFRADGEPTPGFGDGADGLGRARPGGFPGPGRGVPGVPPGQLGGVQLGGGQPGGGQPGGGQLGGGQLGGGQLGGGQLGELPDLPAGEAGGHRRGDRRERRNSVFIPTDEPFAVDRDEVPPVLGLVPAELPAERERW